MALRVASTCIRGAAALARLGAPRFIAETTRRACNLGVAAGARLLGKRFYDRRVHDYRMLLDLHDPGVSMQLMVRGSREPEHRSILQRELAPGMVAFDLGANIGYYALMMARLVGPAGAVYAVEPYPPSFDLLNRNLARNGLAGIVQTWNVGITAPGDAGVLHLADKSNWHSFRPVTGNGSRWKKYARAYSRAIRVPTTSLWEFVQGKRDINLIRMDIEGYEVKVLESLLPHLRRGSSFSASILFETHPEFYDAHDYDMACVLRSLCASGYSVKYLVSDAPRRTAGNVLRQRGYTDDGILEHFPAHDLAIYHGIATGDAIDLIAGSEQVHAALLERRS